MSEDPTKHCTLTSIGGNSVLIPSATVTVTTQQGSAVTAPLGLTPLVIGTSADCDIVLVDSRVSRHHCELRLTPRGIVLRDLGSKNGTLIGEIPIFQVILPLGVVVTLGNSRLAVSVGGAPSTLTLSESGRFGEALGNSVAMRALFARLGRAAATTETVLLLGESGTGKEVLARAIHDASPRKDKPFVVFDCSAIAPSLIEAELFGHARGAFTGAVAAHEGLLEQANEGTLFIDELGELPLDLQPKLLRALEARQVRRVGSTEWRGFDARIVAATHRNLRARVADGSFREDLYYRIAVVEARVPALRERKEDIPQLVERLLSLRAPPRTLADLDPRAVDLLAAYDWPGNVRELRNVVARLVLFPEAALEGVEIPGADERERAPEGTSKGPGREDSGLGAFLRLQLREAREAVLDQFDRRYIAVKLREHGGNVSRTADAVGVSRQLIHRLIERHGLRDE